jgi:hypothetical protein
MSSSDAEFIVTYIAETASKGTIESAKNEIKEIDKVLNEAEKLKIRRMKLVSVLDHLGDNTYKRRRTNSTPLSEDIDISSDEIKELIEKILSTIDRLGSLSVRELVLNVGGYDQDVLIMRAVKFLGEQEIVSRDSEGKIQPGKNWKR